MTAARSWQMQAGTEIQWEPAWLGSERELWLYRGQTVWLLKRYARYSVEVGRLPSLVGREYFRSKITARSRRSFEDVVIFVHDMERALVRLETLPQELIAMNILEEYSWEEMARLLGCCERTIARGVGEALDALTFVLMEVKMIDESRPWPVRQKSCQEGRNGVFELSDTNESENIS